MSFGPLVGAAELARIRREADVRIIDATWRMPAEMRPGRSDYRMAHIAGAVFFDIDEISDRTSPLPHMLPEPGAFSEAAGALGLSRDQPIVVYDQCALFSAPRVWWTLRVMGFPHLAVLDGGLQAWAAAGGEVEAGDGQPRLAATTATLRPDLLRTFDQVRTALQSGAAQVVDARAAARFLGEVPEPRAGLRSGHMPGARNLPWTYVTTGDGFMRRPAELQAAFAAAGVDLARPVIATCGSGVTAAILSLALARLGRRAAAVYDGSWSEWGGRDDAPVSTGS